MPEDEDFFDHGASSLAVIQMQIRIEEALKVTVPTSDLMAQPTINDWVRLYIRAASAATETEIAVPPGTACAVA
jgi:acyl carrier protein